MALTPINEAHALQIQAGIVGRKAGHDFEDHITEKINKTCYPIHFPTRLMSHVIKGDPAHSLLHYIASFFGKDEIHSASALSTGALATSELGKQWLEVNGVRVNRCKSDLIVTLSFRDEQYQTIGVSTKQCNNATPTNAQLYFTTARGFASLLRQNCLTVSEAAISGLRCFCGDSGFRPLDLGCGEPRMVDPRRYFWEEIEPSAREEWEYLFSSRQDDITRLLIQKAYLQDPFVPDFLLHKTRRATSWEDVEVGLYGIEELIHHSSAYGGFSTREYSVRKGSYVDPPGIRHLAPRFGIVQMQRGGQAQHPEQLQFNLEAGYFYKICQQRPNMLANP